MLHIRYVALVISMLGVAACGGSGSSALPPHHSVICPDNPAQCAGSCCGSLCIDTQNDPNNCGGCNVVCPNSGTCSLGSCGNGCGPSGNACDTGQSCCGANGCKSLDSDANNCGSCGNVCDTTETCSSGQCTGGSSTPDMGGSTDECNNCSPACASGDECLGNNCCLTAFVGGTCNPDFNCLGGL